MPRKTAKPKPDDQWYLDDNLWLNLIGALDDDQIEHAARLLHRLAKELEHNKVDGAYRVRCCLENAQRLAFPHTRLFNDCKLLFYESLDQLDTLTLAHIRNAKRSRPR